MASKSNQTVSDKNNGERAVIVTTELRGVFFGYAKDTAGDQIKLRAARLCVYWSPNMHGFMGLGAMGPDKNCKIGPPVDITLRAITAVIEASPEAIERWEAAPWA